jgi:ParB-like nuclease domain
MAHSIRKRAESVAPRLTVVWRRIEALRPDPANPRSHGPRQIRQLACSISAFGFNVPILVDRSLRIIAGHGRLLAAQELGWTEVPTILLDHLSEEKTRAFTIADNRLAEGAAWNDRLLNLQLKELALAELDFAIDATGFEFGEIELRIGAAPSGARFRKRRPTSAPRGPSGSAPAVARGGDWWLLDRHRVGCGDCADEIARILAREASAVVVLAADPAAVDAIIGRWQALTGGSARPMASPAAGAQEMPDAG